MNLPIPVVSVDPGPDWGTNVNSSLTTIDQHDHTSGLGRPITQSAISLTGNLSINNYSLTNVTSTVFSSQVSSLSTLDTIYVVGNELYYNDGIGNVVPITHNGNVNAGAGSITGLVSPASASYQSVGGTFVFQSNTSTPANIDGASFIVRQQTASAVGITISSPSGLASPYTITLPTVTPSAQALVSMSTSGALSNVLPDGTSMAAISGSVLSVATNPAFLGSVSVTNSTTYCEMLLSGTGTGYTFSHLRVLGANQPGCGVYSQNTTGASAGAYFAGKAYNSTDYIIGFSAGTTFSAVAPAANITSALVTLDTSGNMTVAGSFTYSSGTQPPSPGGTSGSGSGSYSTTSTTLTTVGFSAPYTSKGGPVLVFLAPYTTGATAIMGLSGSSGTGGAIDLVVTVDSTSITATQLRTNSSVLFQFGPMFLGMVLPSAGAHTYDLKVATTSGYTLTLSNFILVMQEI